MRNTKEYIAWRNIKSRCYQTNWRDYQNWGGRGISVCQRWKDSFINFFTDLGKAPGPEYSIDRIDNDGDYEPSNCRWATALEQRHNRRDKKIAREMREVA